MKRFIPLLIALALILTACQPKPTSAHDIAVELATIQAAAFTPVVVSTPTNQPLPTFTPTNTPIPALPTFTPVPTATTIPSTPQSGYQLTTGNVCITGGGNEGVEGNAELIWVEDVTSFKAGLHYQHKWTEVSNITVIGTTTLNPTWEGLNDTAQFKSCWDTTSQSWKGWMFDRNADSKFPFWVGISFSQWLSSSTIAVNEHDVNNLGAGKYAEYGTTYTFAEMRLLPGASEISAHIDAAEALANQISAGQIYIPINYQTWSGQWVLMAFQK
jgi:hypothetical protein